MRAVGGVIPDPHNLKGGIRGTQPPSQMYFNFTAVHPVPLHYACEPAQSDGGVPGFVKFQRTF
jgi:hypothetical protein